MGASTADFLSPAPPRIFAHRGLATDAPENTLLAFAAAILAGALYVETDVHASSDGACVIAHDPDLTRTAGRGVRVDSLTLAELKAVNLGNGQSFCTLDEALEAFPDTRFNIDVKSAEAVGPVVEAITWAGAFHRVLVSSFSESRRSRALGQLPLVVSSASARRFAIALVAGKLGLQPIVNSVLRGLVAVQVPERALGLTITTAPMIARLHRAGVEVHIWTINDPERMSQLLDLGVDGIVTDRADLALAVVAARPKL